MSEQVLDPSYNRAMVVVAHADDAEYGCSGTVAKWCKQGWEVVYVLCTDGSKGTADPGMTSDKLVAIRREEQIKAGKILGLHKVEFLNYPDSFLTPSLELRKDIVKAIRLHKPDVLITTDPRRNLDETTYIGHPDHHAAGEAALSAVFPSARDRLTYPDLIDQGLEPHHVSEAWVMFGGQNANRHVELTEEDVDRSIAALQAHRSQVPMDVGERVREWKARSTEKTGFKYAESFRVFALR